MSLRNKIISTSIALLILSSYFFVIPHAEAATLLMSDNFESGNFSKWLSSSDSITQQVVHGGNYALKYGGYPGTVSYFRSATDIYFSEWLYYPSGHDWNNGPGRHYWRLNYGDTSRYGVASVDVTTASEYRGYQFDMFLGSGEQIFSTAANVLPEGRWFQMEFHIKLNDKGQNNGILETFIDKQPVLISPGYYKASLAQTRLTGIDFKWTYPFNNIQLTSNYAGCSTGYAECTWYIDDFELWEGCPPGSSCAGSSTSTPPPPVPTPTPVPTPAPTTTSTPTSPTSSGGPSPSSSDTIIFQDDFESGNLNKWDDIATSRYSVTSDLTKVKSGTKALDGLITPTNGYGSINKWFMPGYDEVYVKYHVMFENGFINRRGDGNGMHFFVLKGNNINNKWSASGKAGIVPSGSDYFYAGIDPEYVFDNTPFPLATYTYYPDMAPPWGNAFKETSPKINLVPGQWHEIVFRVKLNTPGQKNGIQELWVDGVKKINVQNLRWRDTTDLRINQIDFDNYMPGAPKTEHIWVDNLVAWKPGATVINPTLTPTSTPSTLKGDINNDGIVNSLDWSLMNSKWFTNDTTADINNDGIVNSLDFSIMNGNWLKII